MHVAIRYGGAYIAAVLTTAVVGSVSSSQFVYAALVRIDGVSIPFGTWLQSTLVDLKMMLTLAPVLAIGLLLGFLVAGALNKWTRLDRKKLMIAAGGAAWLVAILIMSQVFSLNPIAGARSMLGLVCQVLAGMLGGYAFHFLSKPNNE